MADSICCVIADKKNVKKIKQELEKRNILHSKYRITKMDPNTCAIPVSTDKCSVENNLQTDLLPSFKEQQAVQYLNADELLCSKVITPRDALVQKLEGFFKTKTEICENERNRILQQVPHKWEIHGDMLLLPRDCLTNAFWETGQKELWEIFAKVLKVKRVAVMSRVQDNMIRTPKVALKLGADGWVKHVDNEIIYSYDVTKCMFSKGNITEKMRIARLDCREEIVVDLFAGIGYFTLPYLVKAQAKKLYACEINPDACAALKKNLGLNHVDESRYQILQGDNREVCPKNIADRVNLGLIPSSSLSWATACHALNQAKGGWLHIHENVDSGANALDSGTGSDAILQDHITNAGEFEICQHVVKTEFVPCRDGLDVTDSEPPEDIELETSTLSEKNKAGPLDTEVVNKERDLSITYEKSKGMSVDNYVFPECNDLERENRNLVRDCYKGKLSKHKCVVWQAFVDDMLSKLKSYLPPLWKVTLRHIEFVKSYAPHVDHLVFDIECRPISDQLL
ncbi:tRNA wybutosine-synthesizing protein 2 homolog [Clytia hemisphaerica]|uniref:tRNA(Phe) (4-demethylwyosine(37)-C(7)) aminocarboxypropyltransferase n=1 Tax=Clytia hemisphaerica TaxID=252671 RepID=A0A7M5WWE7_9CNID|eukprot:TCONS_00013998-protein